jgi:hypothetical protein
MDFVKPVLWGHPTHIPTPSQLDSFQEEKISFIAKEFPDIAKFLQNCPSDPIKLTEMSKTICDKLAGFSIFQLGGSPALLGKVCKELGRRQVLNEEGVDCFPLPFLYFANSERISEEITNVDGSVTKISNFVHINWTEL